MTFLGPLAQLEGKADVLEGAERFFHLFNSLNVRASFGSDTQAMLAYDLDFPTQIGSLRVAALLTFEDGLIRAIELFCDGRQFDQK